MTFLYSLIDKRTHDTRGGKSFGRSKKTIVQIGGGRTYESSIRLHALTIYPYEKTTIVVEMERIVDDHRLRSVHSIGDSSLAEA